MKQTQLHFSCLLAEKFFLSDYKVEKERKSQNNHGKLARLIVVLNALSQSLNDHMF